MNARSRFTLCALFLCLLAFPGQTVAQLVATKDLTYAGYSPAHVSIAGIYRRAQLEAELESCIKAGRQPHASHSDGITVSIEPENLDLEITSVEPALIYEGRELTLVVHIKNKGDAYVEIPWQEKMVDTESPDERDRPRKSVDYVSIEVALNSRHKKFELKGGVSLQARFSQAQHWLTLKPGEWAEIKFHATLQPDPKEDAVLPDPAATLSASWSQSIFAETRGECSIDSEYYEGRGLRSKPFAVAVVAIRK